jgi:D-alanyl-D-alanine-carboxypeptidase/D-alanyl-D-alanine-endopeptidase
VPTLVQAVPARQPEPPELLDTYIRPLLEDGRVPAVAAAVIRQDATALLATGPLRRGAPDTADTGTAFELGSVSKTFTALLFAEMAASGIVGFDTPVNALLPPVPRTSRGRFRNRHEPAAQDFGTRSEVTLLDLATHTAGLPRIPRDLYRRAILRWLHDPYGRYSRDDLYRAFIRHHRSRTPARAPGDQPASPARSEPSPHVSRYSTFGVALLGELLAEAAGTGFADLLAARVLRPLGMSGSGIPPAVDAATPAATGHRHGRPAAPWTFDAFAPAGAVRCSAAGMLRYLQALLRPEDMPPALASALRAVQRPRQPLTGRASEAEGTNVALVWNHRIVRGETMLWHTGGTGGFTAFAAFSPTAGTGAAVLANARPVHRDPVLRAGRRLFRAATFGPAAHAPA